VRAPRGSRCSRAGHSSRRRIGVALRSARKCSARGTSSRGLRMMRRGSACTCRWCCPGFAGPALYRGAAGGRAVAAAVAGAGAGGAAAAAADPGPGRRHRAAAGRGDHRGVAAVPVKNHGAVPVGNHGGSLRPARPPGRGLRPAERRAADAAVRRRPSPGDEQQQVNWPAITCYRRSETSDAHAIGL